MIKNIIFDFARTLAELKPEKTILKKYLKNKKIKKSKEQLIRAYDEVDNKTFYSSVKIKTFSQRKNFYKKYNKNLFEKLDLDSKLSYEFYNYFTKINKSWVLYPEVQLVLKKFQKNITFF